jgi:hypothetical protein
MIRPMTKSHPPPKLYGACASDHDFRSKDRLAKDRVEQGIPHSTQLKLCTSRTERIQRRTVDWSDTHPYVRSDGYKGVSGT